MHFFFTNRFVPVEHLTWKHPSNLAMETLNLWMWPHSNTPTLLYRPGRAIAFDDKAHAVRFLGVSSKIVKAFRGIMYMELITEFLSKHFETMIFFRHLDGPQTRGPSHGCDPGKSLYSQELVALRGWDVNSCPGHENLTRPSGPCDCARGDLFC